MRTLRFALGLVVVVCAASGSVAKKPRAQPPQKVAKQHLRAALKHLGRSPSDAVYASAKQEAESALLALRDAGPLTVRKAIVIDGGVAGFSAYKPIPKGLVTGRTVNIYLEVDGFGALLRSDGQYDTQLEVTGTFAYEDGTALGDKSLGTRRVIVHERSSIAAFATDLSLSEKAPGGTYTVDVKVRCVHTGKTGHKKVSFTLPDDKGS